MQSGVKKSENLIFDVGMHHGQDTDYYLKRGFHVVGFEANPHNAKFCRERFKSAIDSGQLVIVEGAIADRAVAKENNGKVRFFLNQNSSLWGSTSVEWAERSEMLGTVNQAIEVDAVDFVECLNKFGIPRYLKADIVGHEIMCLKALLEFENKPDYISIRSEKVIFDKLRQEFDLFNKLGYDRFKVIQQSRLNWQTNYKSADDAEIVYNFEEGASGPFAEETEGDWEYLHATLQRYKRIFFLYRLFGDYSFLNRSSIGRKLISNLERIVRRPLPGWYDTHAKHSSVI